MLQYHDDILPTLIERLNRRKDLLRRMRKLSKDCPKFLINKQLEMINDTKQKICDHLSTRN